MRIAFVNLAADWGGGEGWTLRTAVGLSARGHEILIGARTGGPLEDRARRAGLETAAIPVGVDYKPATILRFFRLFRKRRIDVVVVHQNKDVRTAGVAAKLAGVAVVHRNGFPILKDTPRHRFTTSFVDRILTNSRRIRDHYLAFGWMKTPIDLVYNGILPPGDPDNVQDLRALAGFGESDLVALFAGRLSPVKRVDVLLQAIAALPEDSRWRLAILGTGGEEGHLKSLAKHLGLAGRVVFLGFREEAADLAAGADLAVLASKDEGMPNALMEAMVRGVPAAATPVGDVGELLGDGDAGWLVPLDDIGGWTALFARLEAHPDELVQMGQAGRRRVLERFSFQAMIDGVEASLKRAAPGR